MGVKCEKVSQPTSVRKIVSNASCLDMKRTHSHVEPALTILPESLRGNQKVLKATLEGTHRLHVLSALDISKPASKPIDEIEEPEEEDKALQNRLSRNNARMLQLQLEDLDKNPIRALETEMIKSLSSVDEHSVITIQGPAEVRCGNIMLEAKNITKVEGISGEDLDKLGQVKRQDIEIIQTVDQIKSEDIQSIKNIPLVDLDEDFDDDDCIILE